MRVTANAMSSVSSCPSRWIISEGLLRHLVVFAEYRDQLAPRRAALDRDLRTLFVAGIDLGLEISSRPRCLVVVVVSLDRDLGRWTRAVLAAVRLLSEGDDCRDGLRAPTAAS